MANKWIEISLYDHWSNQPHGIARVTQNLFLASLKDPQYKYFYYCQRSQGFVVPESLEVFEAIASGERQYIPDSMPRSVVFSGRLEAGDWVMVNGAGWGLKDYIPQLRSVKVKLDLKLACIIYDIIAVHSPQFFLGEFAAQVAGFQREIVSLVDHVACISKNTERDVRDYLISAAGRQTTSVFTMGGSFPNVDQSRIGVAGQQVDKKPFILTVGTIEARKNHLLLYYVMRKLVLAYGEHAPDLVIVGRVEWLANDVLQFIERDPLVSHRIHVMNSVTDDELEEMYRSCLFTVYPSFYEGYGLPILESLGRGKICVCSNTSSMPEITPFPELTFDPYDPDGAYEVLSSLVGNTERLRRYEELLRGLDFERSWLDSFLELSAWYREA